MIEKGYTGKLSKQQSLPQLIGTEGLAIDKKKIKK
jgi:hypothetical protein